MKKRLVLCSLSLLCLNGCLLYLFFAPKMDKDDLPQPEGLAQQREMYIAHCARCHVAVAPTYFREDASIGAIVQRYRDGNQITEKEAQAIVQYIKTVTGMP